MANNTTGPLHRGEKGRWINGNWYPSLEFLPDEERILPTTRLSQEDITLNLNHNSNHKDPIFIKNVAKKRRLDAKKARLAELENAQGFPDL
nr:MAG TPA_asm: hypothetical protein [Caudoviricetes sp.]